MKRPPDPGRRRREPLVLTAWPQMVLISLIGRRAQWTGIDARGPAIAPANIRAMRVHALASGPVKALAGGV